MGNTVQAGKREFSSEHGFMKTNSDPEPLTEMIFAGPLRMEYVLTPDEKQYSRLLGGACLYAGVGAKIWTTDPPGLVARVGENFPKELLTKIRDMGLDTRGVRVIPHRQPTDGFYYFDQWDQCIDWDPIKYYTRRNIPLPSELLDYSPPAISESRTAFFPEVAIRSEDVPEAYRGARTAYIGPCHYLSQITLSVAFRQFGVGTICLSPSKGMYTPTNLPQVGQLLHGIDIFFTQEEDLRKLFPTSGAESREMLEFLGRLGPKIILLQRDLQGVTVYDSDSKRAHFTSFYPTEIKNPIGVGDSFCGGFLACWRNTFDPLESALRGCISVSLAVEGMGGLYGLQRNPGLAEARLFSLRQSYAGSTEG
jgi:ribokinase